MCFHSRCAEIQLLPFHNYRTNLISWSQVLILVGDFVEGLEAYFAMQALQMLGYHVDTACPGKKPGDKIATAVHDFEDHQTYSEKRGHNFPITTDFESVRAENYDGLFIPGGRGPEYIRLNPKVLELVRQFNEQKKPIASLCHGPQVLITAGILKGRKVTCYKAIMPDIQMAGATFVQVPNTQAVVDGNIVTGVDWMGNGAVVKAFAELLGTKFN